MDQTTPASAPRNNLLVPAAIVIAGALIAGAIFITNTGKTESSAKSAREIDPSELPSLASSVGVNKKKFQQCLNDKKYLSRIEQMTSDAQTSGGSGTPFSVIVSKAKIPSAVQKLVSDTNKQFIGNNKDYPDILYVSKDGYSVVLNGAMPAQLMDVLVEELVKANSAAANAQPSTQPQVPAVTAEDHIFGRATAPVMIVEYSDTECPYCQVFHKTLTDLVTKYEKDGSVAWTYRHFNTGIHKNTVVEAEALECAAEIGGNEAFWKLLNVIFSKKDFNAN